MFWLFAGLVLGAFFFWLVKNEKLSLKWYEWLLLVLGLILLLFSFQNYSGSVEANEARAATYLLLIFGLPGLIFTALGFVLPFMRGGKAA